MTGRLRRSGYSTLLIDVWAFDATSATPLWRTRLVDELGGVNMGRRLLGVQGGVLWLIDGAGLVGLSPANGVQVAGAETLTAANPQLAGVVPSDERQYRVDPQGVSFTAADGRNWRLTGQGSGTRLDSLRLGVDAQRAPPIAGVALPAATAGGSGSTVFYARSIVEGATWVGLLADAEVEMFRRYRVIRGLDPTTYPLARLYKATVASGPASAARNATHSGPTALPRAPEFVSAGLLQDGRCCHNTPIVLDDPAGVLVLHRERIDGGFRLTRIALPDGTPAWTVDLPLDEIEAVMPGASSVAIQGRRVEPVRGDAISAHVDRLVVIDYATGRVAGYGFRVLATEPADIPPPSER